MRWWSGEFIPADILAFTIRAINLSQTRPELRCSVRRSPRANKWQMNFGAKGIVIGNGSMRALQWQMRPPATASGVELYAAAEYYLHLSEVEGNLAEVKSRPRDAAQS